MNDNDHFPLPLGYTWTWATVLNTGLHPSLALSITCRRLPGQYLYHMMAGEYE